MSQQKVTSVEQAISVLVQAAKIGQAKGAYSLEDASMIAQAIQSLAPKQPDEGQPMPESGDMEAVVTENVENTKEG